MERTTKITKSSISRGAGHFAHIVTPNARVAAGKALRDKIPIEQHARWNAIKRGRDTIDRLRESDIGRVKKLIPIRYGRMLPSPLAFYRGTAGVMAADLARTPTTGLRVQACGDCHLVNFGGFATPERSIIFDINDFDETGSSIRKASRLRCATSKCSGSIRRRQSFRRGFSPAMSW
jgi:hypothetical protein